MFRSFHCQSKGGAQGSRRIGLGITALADALLMLGLNYGEERARNAAAELMRIICHSAYRASVALAKEKTPFPFFEPDKYLQSPFIQSLPEDIQRAIAQDGIRNSHLIAIAPTGTISLLAGNISSGIEPILLLLYTRKVLDKNGQTNEFQLTDDTLSSWRTLSGSVSDFPPEFTTAAELTVDAHLDMQAALQAHVDHSISKTINVPHHLSFDEFSRIYDLAYDKGPKGCTTFRPNPITGTVLNETREGADAPHCCVLEREAD
jgi:ribonucleoside-diphosphate reductase alpha chain